MRLRIILMVVVLFAAPAWAQESTRYKPPPLDPGQDYTAKPYYMMMAQMALSRPPDFHFMSFRSYYSMTEQYDPLGRTTRDKILDLAYQMQNGPDSAQRRMAGEQYAQLLIEHLANIDVVTQALALSRQDKRFGDPEFLIWMRQGLIQSVRESGDGHNLRNAYDALTLGEEDVLFQALGLNVLSTDARESAGIYYNMHEVRNPQTGETYTVFVDISIPMRRLALREAQEKSRLNIPRR